MKSILLLFLGTLLLSHESVSQEMQTQWRVERTNIYFENDLFLNTDNKYTSGLKISNVYFIPKVESTFMKIPLLYDINKSHFISLGIAQQIFTPIDTLATQVIKDDRPYAGWLYLEYGLHQSSADELDSLTLQVGIIGKSSGAETMQRLTHELLGIVSPNGWENQLNDELGVNLIYQHKWRYIPQKIYDVESNFVPFFEASLGNVHTEINSGMLMRFGFNPIEDFGASSIDIGGENGIPIRTECLCTKFEPWSFTFNITLAAKAVAYNIFLDGNTLTQSHSVEKKNLVGYTSLGFSLRYKHIAMDYVLTDFTKLYMLEKSDEKYGSLLFSYIY